MRETKHVPTMPDIPLFNQYMRLEHWVEQLPPAQYSVLMGAVFAVAWAIMEIILGGQSIWMAILLGLPGGVVSGGLNYFWGK